MRQTASGPLRLATTLRGEGALLWGKQAQAPVAYAVDIYRQGPAHVGNGDVRGDLTRLVGRVPQDVRLRLASGEEVRIFLTDIESDVASVELRDQPSDTA